MFCIKSDFCYVFSYSLFKGSVNPLCTVSRKKKRYGIKKVAKLLHICAVIVYHEYLFKNSFVQFVSNTVLCLSYK